MKNKTFFMKNRSLKVCISILICTFFLINLNSCMREGPDTPKEREIERTAPLPQPTADFTVSGGGCNIPCELTFSNKSTHAILYSWDFGDGTGSSEKNPKKKYALGGTYTVTLIARDDKGLTSTKAEKVTVAWPLNLKPPVVTFTISDTVGYDPHQITCTNNTTLSNAFEWSFGDGTKSTSLTTTHTYTAPGDYKVKLMASNPAGIDSCIKHVKILAAPKKMKITGFEISVFPSKDANGAEWDVFNGPDVFFNIVDDKSNIKNYSETKDNLTDGQLPVNWVLGYDVTDFKKSFYLDFIDHDSPDADDFMGRIEINMLNYTTGSDAYPATIIKTQNGFTVKLIYTWEY